MAASRIPVPTGPRLPLRTKDQATRDKNTGHKPLPGATVAERVQERKDRVAASLNLPKVKRTAYRQLTRSRQRWSYEELTALCLAYRNGESKIPGPMDRNGKGKSRLHKSSGLPDKIISMDKATRFSLQMADQGPISRSDSKIPGPIGNVQGKSRQWKSTGLPDMISVFKIGLDKAAKRPKKSVVSHLSASPSYHCQS